MFLEYPIKAKRDAFSHFLFFLLNNGAIFSKTVSRRYSRRYYILNLSSKVLPGFFQKILLEYFLESHPWIPFESSFKTHSIVCFRNSYRTSFRFFSTGSSRFFPKNSSRKASMDFLIYFFQKSIRRFIQDIIHGFFSKSFERFLQKIKMQNSIRNFFKDFF